MGTGTRAAGTPEAELIDNMKDQLLIVLIQRLGGKVSIPCGEIDDTGGLVLMMGIDGRSFDFEIVRKQ